MRDLVRGLPERLYPIGRLDLQTSGLLLLTNDGALAARLLRRRAGRRARLPREGRRRGPAGERSSASAAASGSADGTGRRRRARAASELPTKTWLEMRVRRGRWHVDPAALRGGRASASTSSCACAFGPIELGTAAARRVARRDARRARGAARGRPQASAAAPAPQAAPASADAHASALAAEHGAARRHRERGARTRTGPAGRGEPQDARSAASTRQADDAHDAPPPSGDPDERQPSASAEARRRGDASADVEEREVRRSRPPTSRARGRRGRSRARARTVQLSSQVHEDREHAHEHRRARVVERVERRARGP